MKSDYKYRVGDFIEWHKAIAQIVGIVYVTPHGMFYNLKWYEDLDPMCNQPLDSFVNSAEVKHIDINPYVKLADEYWRLLYSEF